MGYDAWLDRPTTMQDSSSVRILRISCVAHPVSKAVSNAR